MMTIGPVSSIFDFLTFWLLLAVLQADKALFRTGWFVESLATQVLVIFIIRTRANPFKSRAHRLLAATSLAVVAIAIILPFTPLAPVLGFAPLPLRFVVMLLGLTAIYLVLVEMVKRWFYRRLAARQALT